MSLRKILVRLCFSLPLFLGMAVATANENAVPQKPATSIASTDVVGIPYKQEPKSFAEQSLSTLFITLLVLGVTVFGLYTFRNYLQKKTGRTFIKPSAITIKERVRISPKLSMYVVTYRNKEILVAQIGDSVTPISEFSISPALSTQQPDHTQVQPEHHAHS